MRFNVVIGVIRPTLLIGDAIFVCMNAPAFFEV